MGRDNRRAKSARTPGRPGLRSWPQSLFWAALVVGVSIIVSATINPLFGRAVHWDWMAGVAPAGFAILAVALRRRWV